MPQNYQWIQLSSALAQLAQRLSDPTNIFWSTSELTIYIQQALRMFNALTFTWKRDFTYNSPNVWNSLATLPGSPRTRTLTDSYCYTQIEYMLLEPPTGGTWTGTSQFNMDAISQALQARRDEMIQVANLNQSLLTGIVAIPNERRTYLPDSVIDVARVRWIPVSGNAVTLYRDDTVASEFYQAPLYQLNSGTPQSYGLSSEPPLSFDVDIPPSQPGTFEAVVLQAGSGFAPPASTLVNIPDDFAWTLIYGALGDLLGRESEATDTARAQYCAKRYLDGLMILQKTPWIMLGKVNQQAVSVDSIFALDRYSPNWDSMPMTFGPVIGAAGMDFLAAPTDAGIAVTCLGNAPVPTLTTDYLQVSQSNYDTVLDLAQSLACFKMGGAEWQQALELEGRAVQACSAENTRLRSLGAFSDILVERGQDEERDQNRYNDARKVSRG